MKQRRPNRDKPGLTARTADVHDLYERSVFDAEPLIRLITRIYRNETGMIPLKLREDFCGTARLCVEWVLTRKERRALGVDIDGTVLDYCRRRHFPDLDDEQRKRVRLLQEDVRKPVRGWADVTVAFNFSWWIFKERKVLLDYFRVVRRGLGERGIFLLDLHGGPDAQIEKEERTRRRGGFTYVWDQDYFNPIDHHTKCYIHFEFRDGTRIRKAFVYDWRVWTLPETVDILYEAGFSRVDVYWEGEDDVYRKSVRADNLQSWIAVIAAHK